MKTIAAVVEGPGAPFELQEVDLDGLRDDEVLVDLAASGICHTDLGARAGAFPTPFPVVLGHEGAGTVAAVGQAVTRVAPGDRVALSYDSCGGCATCEAARPSYCHEFMPRNFLAQRVDGTTSLIRDGEPLHAQFFGQSSFAAQAICHERAVVRIEAEIPLEVLAPFGCGVQTGAGAVMNVLRPAPGSSIAIFGAGAVGLSAVMAARLVGAKQIVAVDINRARLDLALELGATHAIDAGGEDVAKQIRAVTGRGMSFSFNTTTVPAVHSMALDCLAMNGTAGFVAAPRGEWAPQMFAMLAGGRQLRGILGGDANPRTFLPKLIDYWTQGRFPFDRLIETYGFAEIGKAFHDCEHGTVIKPVLKVSAP